MIQCIKSWDDKTKVWGDLSINTEMRWEVRGYLMDYCSHENCGIEERVWLPKELNSISDIALHPWCKFCGVIKNISDDRPKKIGYWINILSTLAKRFSLTQSQKHLIIKELESNKFFNDAYCINNSSQKKVFIKVVAKYCALSENTINSYIY